MFIHRPFRLMFTAPLEEGGGKQEDPKPKPTAEMTAEERAEFEEKAKRRAQDKLKAFNGKTPEDVAKLEQELERLRKEKLTEQERAVEEARAEARTAAFAEANSQTVETSLRIALRGRTADAAALLDLDRSTFVADGRVDADAIAKWVEDNSAPTGGGKRPPVKIGQGYHEQLKVSDRETGKAEAEKRFGKKN